MTIAPIEADRPRPLGRGAKHESGISSEYSLNTLETTMTPNETSPDQAVEAVALGPGFTAEYDESDDDFTISWPDGRYLVAHRSGVLVSGMMPQSLGITPSTTTIAALSAIPTPPPADHTDLIAKMRAAVLWDEAALIIVAGALLEQAADALQARELAERKRADHNWNVADYFSGLLDQHGIPYEWPDAQQTITKGVST